MSSLAINGYVYDPKKVLEEELSQLEARALKEKQKEEDFLNKLKTEAPVTKKEVDAFIAKLKMQNEILMSLFKQAYAEKMKVEDRTFHFIKKKDNHSDFAEKTKNHCKKADKILDNIGSVISKITPVASFVVEKIFKV